MITHDMLELSKHTLQGIQFLAVSYGIETQGKNKQTLITEIMDIQSEQLHNQ